MRRWDPAVVPVDNGYILDMEERDDGEYVRYSGHSAALYAATRDARRRMIAALYWQAGACSVRERALTAVDSLTESERYYLRVYAFALHDTAVALEAAL